MNEKLDYAGVEKIILQLDQISARMQEILTTTTEDLGKINSDVNWKSPAAQKTIEIFTLSSVKFEKFPKEVASYATHLRKVLDQYGSLTSTAATQVASTTDTYVSEING